jgi:Methyltransferase FkbM domain
MKIDVEGAELLVLNSAIETLKQGRIETMNRNYDNRVSFSWKLYSYYQTLERVKVLNNFKRATPNR